MSATPDPSIDVSVEIARAVEAERAWRRRAVLARAGVAERVDGHLGTLVRRTAA
jgi:hypothetical protein